MWRLFVLLLSVAGWVAADGGNRGADATVDSILGDCDAMYDRLVTSSMDAQILGTFWEREADSDAVCLYENEMQVRLQRDNNRLRLDVSLTGTRYEEAGPRQIEDGRVNVTREEFWISRRKGDDFATASLHPGDDWRQSLSFYAGPIHGYSGDFGRM